MKYDDKSLKIWFCDEKIPWYDIYLWNSWSLVDIINNLWQK